MTPQKALGELLARVGAAAGSAVFIGIDELEGWPVGAVASLKGYKVLREGRPAASVVCSGCERECVMAVHVLPATDSDARAFVLCDKRHDINRVPVPIARLTQFVASGESVADLVASLLGLHRPAEAGPTPLRWEIGILKGRMYSSHLVLHGQGELKLLLAGHSVVLADVLKIEGGRLTIDRRRLVRLVDSPVAAAGDGESAAQRRVRLKAEIQAEKLKGTRAFLQVVAGRERITPSRLKQLVYETQAPSRTGEVGRRQPRGAIPKGGKLQR